LERVGKPRNNLLTNEIKKKSFPAHSNRKGKINGKG
jgi:hypothetical protein